MTAEEFERQVIAGEITDFEPYLNNAEHILHPNEVWVE